jgi:EpsI family protein
MVKQEAITDKVVMTGIILFSCVVILILVYQTSAISLYQGWMAKNSLTSHGLLLLPLSCYLLAREWYRHRNLWAIRSRPGYWLLLALLSMIWLLSDIAKIQLVTQMVLILILCLMLFALFGAKRAALLAFPVLIMLSATSVWSILAQPLQEPTAYFVNKLLHLTGYASYQEGQYITIPEGVFEVGDTCSGLRYQIAAITLALLYAFFSRFSLFISLVYLLLASGVAFSSNIIRIYIVVLSGHYTHMTHSLLDDHIWLGWVVFAICYAIFLFVTMAFDTRLQQLQGGEKGRADTQSKGNTSNAQMLMIASIVILSASIGPIYRAYWMDDFALKEPTKVSLKIDDPALTVLPHQNDWMPMWQNADSQLRMTYRFQDFNIDFYSAYYGYQDQGKEAISNLNYAYNPDNWRTQHREVKVISLQDGRKLALREAIISDDAQQRRIVWSWYYVGGYATQSEWMGKLYGMVSGLRGRSDAAAVVLSTRYSDNGMVQREMLKSFVDQIINQIEVGYGMRAIK